MNDRPLSRDIFARLFESDEILVKCVELIQLNKLRTIQNIEVIVVSYFYRAKIYNLTAQSLLYIYAVTR